MKVLRIFPELPLGIYCCVYEFKENKCVTKPPNFVREYRYDFTQLIKGNDHFHVPAGFTKLKLYYARHNSNHKVKY